jgi:hypothetical protein
MEQKIFPIKTATKQNRQLMIKATCYIKTSNNSRKEFLTDSHHNLTGDLILLELYI